MTKSSDDLAVGGSWLRGLAAWRGINVSGGTEGGAAYLGS